MKNLIIGAMIVATTSSYADFKNVEISNFTGSYRKPDGSATATKLVIPEAIASTINIELKGLDNGYLLEYGDEEYLFENPPSFIEDIDSASWNNINYSTNSTKMVLSLNTFKSEAIGSKANVEKFKGNCTLNRDHEGEYGFQLLDACLTNSSFSVSYYLSSKLSNMYNILLDLPGIEGIAASDISIKKATLSVKKNSFKFKGKVDLGISANIKIEGKSHFEVDEKRVTIKIDKAKASFLNIKKRLFDELEKSQTYNFRVNNPYIYIYLK